MPANIPGSEIVKGWCFKTNYPKRKPLVRFNCDIAFSSCVASTEYHKIFNENNNIWFTFKKNHMIFMENMYVNNRSMNYPHSCPVWRKKIHDLIGYFDEINYGPYADYEFWLRCLKNNFNIMSIGDLPQYFYSIDNNSHNKKNKDFFNKIINKYNF